MTVVVTGGAGYIGGVVSARLLEAGHEVIVVDNLSRSSIAGLCPGVRFIRADVAELASVLTPADGVDAVVHLAGYGYVGESVTHPRRYWQNNVVSTLSMLRGMHELGIGRLVFASSCATYGRPEILPITESAPTRPVNAYGMTKLAIDMAIASEATAHDLAATSLRFFNVAGAYAGKGERHVPETHIIPSALAAAAGDRPTFLLLGDDYPTADGTCVRDYIHVADLADATLCALDGLRPGRHTIYNLGNGQGFSNRQIVEAVELVTGRPVPIETAPRRDGDPPVLVASSERITAELGWRPARPALLDMIADAWSFYRSFSRVSATVPSRQSAVPG